MTLGEREPLTEETAVLIAGCEAGDSRHESLLFERYVDRLMRLTEARLSKKLASRVEAGDVVQSAYRSLFLGLRRRAFRFEKSGDLWRLLAEITIRKVHKQVATHFAQRRSVNRQTPMGEDEQVAAILGREPTPDAIALAGDELEHLLAHLDPLGQAIVERRLQGEQIVEIAEGLNCSERTVRRHLQKAKSLLLPAAELADRQYHQPAESQHKSTQPERPEFALPAEVPAIDFHELKLLRQIGEGGSGKVYLAETKRGRGLAAVKFLKKAYWRRPRVVERFLNEANLLSRLRHPHVVNLRGIGQTAGRGVFIVMDYVEGDDLANRSRREGLGAQQVAVWVRQVASAIAFAHRCGVVHCDLKPSNILLSRVGQILVTDFGLAGAADVRKSEPAALGTPAFMAPEQVDADWGEVGYPTDLWGLGALLFTLLVGHPPYAGRTPQEVIDRLVHPDEAPLDELDAASVPVEMAALCRASLRKSPALRLKSADEFERELARFLEQAASPPERGDG